MWNQSLTAKPTPVIFSHVLLNTWMFVFLVSLQTILFCLFSLLHVLGYISCRCIDHLSKCLRLQKHLFILFLLSPLSFPLIQHHHVSSCFCHLFSSQVPHEPLKHLFSCSEETFGHSPIPQVSSVTLLRCSLLGMSFRMENLCTPGAGNVGSQLVVSHICLRLLLGKLSQSSDLTKADLPEVFLWGIK